METGFYFKDKHYGTCFHITGFDGKDMVYGRMFICKAEGGMVYKKQVDENPKFWIKSKHVWETFDESQVIANPIWYIGKRGE